MKHLTLQSELLGALTIPLDKIYSIRFPRDEQEVLVTLQNGDRVQGRLADATLSLSTSFGPVTLSSSLISEMEVHAGAVARAVRWERLFASSGEDETAVSLQGQTARTRETFRGPLIFECTARLEKKMTDGCVWFHFVPQETDGGDPAQDAVFKVVLGDSHRDGSGGHVSLERPDMPAYRLTRHEFVLTANQDYRLGMELRENRLRVRFNNEVFDVANVRLPAGEFRIYVKGWKPENTWLVRDAVVRTPEP
ncbi:MAG: hypothetical protein RMM51_09490 [Verrucomicrobiae bacterium]|nr:hypothetical protein [Verrucomicrobiae bacterium]